jgi:acid stress-induced BolA-like protein IbaG/YrbA
MESEVIEKLILQQLPDAKVEVQGDGHHFQALIVTKSFQGLSRLKQQQMVYEALSHSISSGELHAISLKTFTPEEWEKKNG